MGYDTNPSGECVAGRKRRCSGGRNERDPGAEPTVAFDWLSDERKTDIFHNVPLKVSPAFARFE